MGRACRRWHLARPERESAFSRPLGHLSPLYLLSHSESELQVPTMQPSHPLSQLAAIAHPPRGHPSSFEDSGSWVMVFLCIPTSWELECPRGHPNALTSWLHCFPTSMTFPPAQIPTCYLERLLSNLNLRHPHLRPHLSFPPIKPGLFSQRFLQFSRPVLLIQLPSWSVRLWPRRSASCQLLPGSTSSPLDLPVVGRIIHSPWHLPFPHPLAPPFPAPEESSRLLFPSRIPGYEKHRKVTQPCRWCHSRFMVPDVSPALRPLGPWWSAPALNLYHSFSFRPALSSHRIDRENRGPQMGTPPSSLYSTSLLIKDPALPSSKAPSSLTDHPAPVDLFPLLDRDHHHPLSELLLFSFFLFFFFFFFFFLFFWPLPWPMGVPSLRF